MITLINAAVWTWVFRDPLRKLWSSDFHLSLVRSLNAHQRCFCNSCWSMTGILSASLFSPSRLPPSHALKNEPTSNFIPAARRIRLPRSCVAPGRVLFSKSCKRPNIAALFAFAPDRCSLRAAVLKWWFFFFMAVLHYKTVPSPHSELREDRLDKTTSSEPLIGN